MRAKQWDFEKAALCQKSKLDWDGGEHYRCVHIAEVIRNENIAAFGRDFLDALNLQLHATDPQQRAGPGAGDIQLHASVGVEKRRDQIHRSEHDGGKYH